MDFSTSHILVGVAVGFVVVLLLYNLRLAFQFLVMVGKVGLIVLLIVIVGSILGFWDPPQRLVLSFYGLRRLWQPFQRRVLQIFLSLFR